MKALLKIFFPFFFIFATYSSLLADGSKDMYPLGVAGNRAYLVSGEALQTGPGGHDRFLNYGVHYVYVSAGEVIAVASSAHQKNGLGDIVLTSPQGQVIRASSGSGGRIEGTHGQTNRQAELAGPGVGYAPFEHEVHAQQAGIWRVEFFGTGTQNDQIAVVAADNNWVQDSQSRCIAAWDISVRKVGDPTWIKGRVYASLLNLYIHQNSLSDPNGGLYAQNYVLTKDGYVYRVNANGSHPAKFTYFVNSTGILDNSGQPTYKSSNRGYIANVHDPNLPDQGIHITHKMFYTFPDLTMPDDAAIYYEMDGTQRTWLINSSPVVPEVKNITLSALEGGNRNIIRKGIRIGFDVTVPGSYRIAIASADPVNYPFATRYIPIQTTQSHHEYLWDGLDGDNRFVPIGDDYPIKISISAMEGEIHFPYFDMEINPHGILVERMNPDDTHHSYATMYWDDSDISPGYPTEVFELTSGPEGIPSNINGHKWGRAGETWRMQDTREPNNGTGSFSFGNEKAMDTWSFAVQAFEESVMNVDVRVSDLEVVSISSPQDTIEPGDWVTYQVVARNNGPSDARGAGFEFTLPEGFHIQHASMTSDCTGVQETQPQVIQANHLRTTLDLPDGCTVTYSIRARTVDPIPDATYGYVPALAGMVRPVGYTDPDATSTDVTQTAPLSAEEECQGNCNNIKRHMEVFLWEYEHERGHLALVKEAEQLNTDKPGFFKVGDVVRYTFTVTNVGPSNGVRVDDIRIDDPMLSSNPILPPDRRLELGQRTVISRDYTVTQADIDRKYLENTATVSGKNPRGFDVKDISGTALDNDYPTRIILDKMPVFQLQKSVDNQGTGEQGQFTIGDTIRYRFDVKHSGDIAVAMVTVDDPMIADQPMHVQLDSIANETVTLYGQYFITEADIRTGNVTNSAVAEALDTKYGNRLTDISGVSFLDDAPTVVTLARPPQGVADSYEIYQGHNGVFDVLVNDIVGSSNLDPQTIEIMSIPSMGRVYVKDGKVHYEPFDNYVSGEDSFTYRVKDRSRLYTEETNVQIVIHKTVPVAVDDFVKIGYNYFGTFRPASNDHVEHSQIVPTSVEIIGSPMYGELVHRGDGSWQYTPGQNFNGMERIGYRVMDKNGNWSEPATITIEVTGFMIPNAVTPNGDGKNETIEIIGAYQFDHIELEVIDRFGRQVFYSKNYKNDWKIENTLPEGTYFVILKGVKANAKPVIRKGAVLITRQQHTSY